MWATSRRSDYPAHVENSSVTGHLNWLHFCMWDSHTPRHRCIGVTSHLVMVIDVAEIYCTCRVQCLISQSGCMENIRRSNTSTATFLSTKPNRLHQNGPRNGKQHATAQCLQHHKTNRYPRAWKSRSAPGAYISQACIAARPLHLFQTHRYTQQT